MLSIGPMKLEPVKFGSREAWIWAKKEAAGEPGGLSLGRKRPRVALQHRCCTAQYKRYFSDGKSNSPYRKVSGAEL